MHRTILLLICLAASVACSPAYRPPRLNFVAPDQIAYDKVPGFGAGGGTDILEWDSRSASGSDETVVRASLVAPKGLRLRWLGTAGFEISDDETSILVDPFLSRPPVNPLVSKQAKLKLDIDTEAVDKYLIEPMMQSGSFKKLKAILISHTHHDHAQDVPYILSKFPKTSERPLVAGDQNLPKLLEAYMDREKEIPWLRDIERLTLTRRKIFSFDQQKKLARPVNGKLGLPVGTFGRFTITAFISEHGLYDDIPFTLEGDMRGKAPLTGLEYKAYLNSSMTYLIEYSMGSGLSPDPKRTLRIFATDSARFLNGDLVSSEVTQGGRVDLLLEGIASRKKDNRISDKINGFNPAYFIPTHYDNFFKPMGEFQTFDFEISDPIVAPKDNSNLKEFIQGFCGPEIRRPCPRFRMLKMFYYYSLENFLTNRS